MITPGQPLDLDLLEDIVAAEMPWIVEPERIQVLGFGFRSVAVETAAGEVVLIGKVAETAETYARIYRLALELGRHLPVSIPRPRWFLPASERLPGGALCYPKLPGRPLEMADIEGPARGRIVADLAKLLRAFHRFPVEPARAFDVPAVGREFWVRTVETVLPPLRRALNREEYAAVANWWRGLRDDRDIWAAPQAFRHGDFWHENILIDPNTLELRGILDLEYVALSDRACDLATLRHLDTDFAGEVGAEYAAIGGDLEPDFARRVERYWELREFDGLRFAVEYDDPAEFEDGLQALRAGPILNPLQD